MIAVDRKLKHYATTDAKKAAAVKKDEKEKAAAAEKTAADAATDQATVEEATKAATEAPKNLKLASEYELLVAATKQVAERIAAATKKAAERARPSLALFKKILPWTTADGPSLCHLALACKMMKDAPSAGRQTEFALGWEGQIFVKQAGWRTVVLHVTSEDTVGSLKTRFKWSNSRMIKSPRELWDDSRSLGSYGVRKEDTLLLCGRLGGGAPGSEATANEVAQRHAKLCMDVSGLIRKGKFGGIDVFDSMLEEQVGYMDATALRGMYAEHCLHAACSTGPFSPPNNPGLECTPEREFYYVVGEDGIDIAKWEVKPGARPAKYDGCMVEGRNATPLSELLQADEAKRAKLRDTELIALRLYSGKSSFAGRRYCCLVVLILLHLPFFWRCHD